MTKRPTPHFNTQSPLAQALKSLLTQMEQRMQITQPVKLYLAGGMAAHLYTASRFTSDVDAEFSARVAVPPDITAKVIQGDGAPRTIYFDTNYNSTFALMHEDHQEDAIPLDIGTTHLKLFVLSPVDLAVSKIARLSDNDKRDIADLVREGLVSPDEIKQRAEAALGGYVGGVAMLTANLNDAYELAMAAQGRTAAPSRPLPADLAIPSLSGGVLTGRQAGNTHSAAADEPDAPGAVDGAGEEEGGDIPPPAASGTKFTR